MQGIHARPFTEANLTSARPEPLSAATQEELLAVLRRTCGDDACVENLAYQLSSVLISTISFGDATSRQRTGSVGAWGTTMDRLLWVAYQLVLPSRCARLSAAAVLAASLPFKLGDVLGNQEVVGRLLEPAAFAEALADVLLRPEVAEVLDKNDVLAAALMADMASALGGSGSNTTGVLLFTVVPTVCAHILDQQLDDLPQSAGLFMYLAGAMIDGLAPENNRPEWPHLQEETLVDVLVWSEQLTALVTQKAAESGHEHHEEALSEPKVVQTLLGKLMQGVCARFSSQQKLPPAAARKVLSLFQTLTGRFTPFKPERMQPAALIFLNTKLHAVAIDSLPLEEELQQMAALAAGGARVVEAMPQQASGTGAFECINALTGILRCMTVPARPPMAHRQEPPTVEHAMLVVQIFLAPLMERLVSWFAPYLTQASSRPGAPLDPASAIPATLPQLVDQVNFITITISSMLCTYLVAPLLIQPSCSTATLKSIAASGALTTLSHAITLPYLPKCVELFSSHHKDRAEVDYHAASKLLRAANLVAAAPDASAGCMKVAASVASTVLGFAANELLRLGAAAWVSSPSYAQLNRACGDLQALSCHARSDVAAGALAAAAVPRILTNVLHMLEGRGDAARVGVAMCVHNIKGALAAVARTTKVAEASSEGAHSTMAAAFDPTSDIDPHLGGPGSSIEGLARTMNPDNLLRAEPELPDDAIIKQLAEKLADGSHGGPWWQPLLDVVDRIRDRCRQQHGAVGCAWELLTIPALCLLMRVEHTDISAAALCAVASRLQPGRLELLDLLRKELPARWHGLLHSVGEALKREPVLAAAVAAMPESVGLASLFAMISSMNANRAQIPNLRFPELLPAMSHVARAIRSANTDPDKMASFNLALSASSYLMAMNHVRLPMAARRRWLGSPVGLTAATDILDTATVVFVCCMRAAHTGDSEMSEVYITIRQQLLKCMSRSPTLAEVTNLAALPSAAARNILSVVRQLMEGPFGAAADINEHSTAHSLDLIPKRPLQVQSEHLVDIAAALFARDDHGQYFAHLVAAAVATLPLPEQRLHYDTLTLAALTLFKVTPPDTPVAELLPRLQFQAAAIRMLVSDEQRYPLLKSRQQDSGGRMLYFAKLLQWMWQADSKYGLHYERFDVLLPEPLRVEIPNTPDTLCITDVWALMAWMARRATSFVAHQLLADLGPVDDVPAREAAAVAAVEANHPEALMMMARLETRIWGPDETVAKDTSVRQALTALIEVTRIVATQRAPRPKVYGRCCRWLGSSIIATGLLESGTNRPLGTNGFKKPPAGAKSIGELHADMCQVLCQLAAREASTEPGVVAKANDGLFVSLPHALQTMQARIIPGHPPPPYRVKASEAAFCATAEALLAVIQHCRGARAALHDSRRWEHLVPPTAVLAGNQRVAAAVASIRAALAGAARGGNQARPTSSAAQAAEAAAAALMAEEDAEKQQEAAKQGKAAKRRKARQRAAQAQQPAGSTSPAAEAAIPDASGSAATPALEPAPAARAPAVDGSGMAAAAAEQLQGASLQNSGPAAGGAAVTNVTNSWQLCPLTKVRMLDPVLAADQHSYERTAIEEWLASHHTSPVTGEPLPHTTLIPNHALRNLLAAIG